ncbi:TonB family protein [Paraburkholderia sp. MPAMCS5]|uniref:TonB family protein n=1 Tax=Paraburkholderia sp. MPAMCS5 TaxID=3112563 RepID=UPI002E1892BF|nr:TonB family protein [Paraburkholderia sp. MPAMCS5]
MATTGWIATDAARRRWAALVLVAVIVVIAAHAGMLMWLLSGRDQVVERTIEARPIVASLLSAEPDMPAVPDVPAFAGPAVTSHRPPAPVAAQPQNAHRSVRTQPSAVPHVNHPRNAAPRARIETNAPNAPNTVNTPPGPPPSNETAAIPAPATPSESEAADATARAAPSSATPRAVAHGDCNIPKPDYPDMSKRRNETGTTVVRFVVGVDGHIETAQVQTGSGYARLDDAALAAIHAGTCRPYREHGVAVRAAYSQSFVFGLSD